MWLCANYVRHNSTKPLLTAVFNFFTNILKIIVFLFCSIKIITIFTL